MTGHTYRSSKPTEGRAIPSGRSGALRVEPQDASQAEPPATIASERTAAQFFFEVGYGACWAEAFIRNGETPPFPLTDAMVERAWQIAPEAHDDPAEFDAHKALADAAPDLLKALQWAIEEVEGGRLYERMCCDGRECGCRGADNAELLVHHLREAVAKATGAS